MSTDTGNITNSNNAKGITNFDALPSDELRELFHFIHLNSRWFFELLNRLKIGFYWFYDSRYIIYNDKFMQIIQYNPDELENLKVGDVVFERERKIMANKIEKLQKGQIGALASKVTIIRGNKKISTVQYYAFKTAIQGHPICVGYVLDEQDHDLDDKIRMKMTYSIIVELQGNVEAMLHLNETGSTQEILQPNFRKDLHRDYGLSKREQEVLQYIYNGYSNQQIANKLFISKRTVEFHRSNLMEKTGTKNGVELVHFAVKSKLIAPDNHMNHFPSSRN